MGGPETEDDSQGQVALATRGASTPAPAALTQLSARWFSWSSGRGGREGLCPSRPVSGCLTTLPRQRLLSLVPSTGLSSLPREGSQRKARSMGKGKRGKGLGSGSPFPVGGKGLFLVSDPPPGMPGSSPGVPGSPPGVLLCSPQTCQNES